MHSIPSRLALKLFGSFEMAYDGRPITNVSQRKTDRLLAYLTLYNRTMPIADVAEAIWPDTANAEDCLRHSVVHLRGLLAPETNRLETPRGYLRLDLEGVIVDTREFDAATLQGERKSLETAISLFRGDLLHGWAEDWIKHERTRLHKNYLRSLRKLGRLCREEGDYEAAADYLSRLVKYRKDEERVWLDLVQALLYCRERILAQQRFAEYEAHLRTKGLQPSPDMLHLKKQISEGMDPPTPPSIRLPDAPIGGALSPDSPWYLRRSADQEFLEAVIRQDSIVLVKGPRQTGKSSLLARGLAQARKNGARVVTTDLQSIGIQHWASTETFTLALAQNLADQLTLERQPAQDWAEHRGPIGNFERYVRQEALSKSDVSLVWGIDELDRLFPYPFSSELFGLFRAWHNARASNPDGPWRRLTLVMAYATEAHLFISDLSQSPFAVGTRVSLEDFAPWQIAEMNLLYRSPLQGEALTRLGQRVGGHPYLIHRGLYELAAQRLCFAELMAKAARPDGPFGDHLKRLLNDLCRDNELCEGVRSVLQNRPRLTANDFCRLKSAGVLKGDGPENAEFRCPLYRDYLEVHLR
ncbi:MAG TPA: AAA-like domain-containing protein [Chthonomonadaceae bacterium]|nr:AAA-like domain-containing protein [Chthonomonadaceae bacterium]